MLKECLGFVKMFKILLFCIFFIFQNALVNTSYSFNDIYTNKKTDVIDIKKTFYCISKNQFWLQDMEEGLKVKHKNENMDIYASFENETVGYKLIIDTENNYAEKVVTLKNKQEYFKYGKISFYDSNILNIVYDQKYPVKRENQLVKGWKKDASNIEIFIFNLQTMKFSSSDISHFIATTSKKTVTSSYTSSGSCEEI